MKTKAESSGSWGLRCAAIIFCVASLGGCAAAPRPDATKSDLVLVTLSPLADIVKNVAGDDLRVLSIVPPDTDPHAFTPTPADARQIAEASVVFRDGHGIDDWLSRLTQSSDAAPPLFDLTRGLTLEPLAKSRDDDPHIWMDPLRVLAMTQTICDDLSKLQPKSAAAFRRRADDYEKKLRELDAWVKSRVALIPPSRRKLVTSHDAMGYFARRYGFQIVGFAVPGGGTDESGTNAHSIAALIDQIRVAKVPAVFVETSTNPALMERIGAEAKVRVVTDLHIDSLGKPGTPSGTYLGFYHENVNKIVEALRG